MHYRGFYLPGIGSYKEDFVDSEELDQLPAGALFIVQVNEDGTREVIYSKEDRTPKEDMFWGFAQRYLEPKHDGGPTPEMIAYLREHRSG